MTTATAPRTVTLPECPVCGLVGKQPQGTHKGRQECMGPKGAVHTKTRMRPTLWRKVEEAA
jgi:hypothetical protein